MFRTWHLSQKRTSFKWRIIWSNMSEFCLLSLLSLLPSNQRVSQLKGNKPCLYTGPIIDHNLGHPSLSKPPLFLSFSSSPSSSSSFSLSLFHSRTRWRQWTQGRSIFPGSLKIIRNTVLLPSFLLPVFLSFSFHFHLDEIHWLILQFFTILYFLSFNFSIRFAIENWNSLLMTFKVFSFLLELILIIS